MVKPLVAAVLGAALGASSLRAAVPMPRVSAPAASPAKTNDQPAPRPLELAHDGIALGDDALYVLGWEPDEGTTPLHAVAIDRATLAVVWRSRALPSRPRGEGGLAIGPLGPDAIFVRDGAAGGYAADAHTGELTPAERVEPPACERGQTCADLGPLLKRLGMKPDEEAVDAVAEGRLLRIYVGAHGQYRLVARQLSTRVKLYDIDIPGLAGGSRVGTVRADGDELFVVGNGDLFVIDARTGRVLRRFGSF